MHFGFVLKLRDDSMALRPWIIPSDWEGRGLVSLRCQAWGGIMDAAFVVGRRWAWTIMEGMSAEWYLSHDAFSEEDEQHPSKDHSEQRPSAPGSQKKKLKIPRNPESWLATLAKMNGVPTQVEGFCNMPFVSIRLMRLVKGRHRPQEKIVIKPSQHKTLTAKDTKCFDGPAARGRSTCRGTVQAMLSENMSICPRSLCLSR